MSAHREPLTKATASLMEIIGLWQSYQAALIQGDVNRAEATRLQAHDVLDAYFDRGSEVATAVRSLTE